MAFQWSLMFIHRSKQIIVESCASTANGSMKQGSPQSVAFPNADYTVLKSPQIALDKLGDSEYTVPRSFESAHSKL